MFERSSWQLKNTPPMGGVFYGRGILFALAVCSLGPCCSAAGAEVPSKSLDEVRRLAILHNGRLKPFDSFARETLTLIDGAPRFERRDPVATVLAIAASPSEWVEAKIISVPFVPLRERLGIDRTAARVSLNDLVSTRALMRMLPAIVQKQQREEKLTMLESEAMDLYNRFVAFNGLLKQEFALVPPPVVRREAAPSAYGRGVAVGDAAGGGIVPPSRAEGEEWLPVLTTPLQERWAAVVSAFQRGDAAQLTPLSRQFGEEARRLNPSVYPPAWRIRLEVFYNHARPFALARVMYALAVLAFLVGLSTTWQRIRIVALSALAGGFILHGAGILSRVILGGRPPVSNFFETMLWLPFVVVGLSLVFEWIYRVSFFGLAASALAAITLLLADFVPLDSSISPVVAVLHSNLWLTIHVLTIVASYGALALAVGLAHIYGWLYLVRRGGWRAEFPTLETCVYRAIQVGVVLLAGGIMLGAVWANASWGRYWGWDPKETWSLITLLWFVAVLHGRLAGWLRGIGIALCTICGFFLLLMTYYGVSFYLVGLHSYAGGHAKPVPPLLIAYLMAEAAFVLAVGMAAARRRSPA